MLHPIRRVVAGLDPEGRSCVLFDGDATTAAENPDWPGFGVKLLWLTEQAPAAIEPGIDAADRPLTIMPPPGGSTCVVCEFPPLSSLEAMTPQQRNAAQKLTFGNSGDEQSLQLHATPTLDYLVMLSGELTLLLEAGETTLRTGDILIDCGVKHGWENRGHVPAICLSVMIVKA
ncbi:MAG: cupin domain-containing protein [Spongiibacteraceae bacterium]